MDINKSFDVRVENDIVVVHWIHLRQDYSYKKIRAVCTDKRTLKTFYAEYDNGIFYLDGDEYSSPFDSRVQSIIDCIFLASSYA